MSPRQPRNEPTDELDVRRESVADLSGDVAVAAHAVFRMCGLTKKQARIAAAIVALVVSTLTLGFAVYSVIK